MSCAPFVRENNATQSKELSVGSVCCEYQPRRETADRRELELLFVPWYRYAQTDTKGLSSECTVQRVWVLVFAEHCWLRTMPRGSISGRWIERRLAKRTSKSKKLQQLCYQNKLISQMAVFKIYGELFRKTSVYYVLVERLLKNSIKTVFKQI